MTAITRSPDHPIGFVEIVRRRGRIAGFGFPKCPVDVLWCGTNRPRKKHGARQNGWSFPPAVRELLLQETAGTTVLHPFGGRADFGVRMDIDASTQPDVIGDAYFPPFARDSFDNVILNPPYRDLHQQEKMALLWASAWVARKHVYWFATQWLCMDRSLPLIHAWLIRVGDMCSVRCLQKFEVREPKRTSLCVQPVHSQAEQLLRDRGHEVTYLEPAPSELWGAK